MPFQYLVDRVLSGDMKWWDSHRRYIAHFYALWKSRFTYASNPMGDVQATGLTAQHLSKDQEEALERNGYLFMTGGSMPARQINGLHMQLFADHVESQIANLRWGVWTAAPHAGEFVVPDFAPYRPIVPLTPHTILISDMDDAVVGREEVAQINLLSAVGANRFVFARDYNACPMVPEEPRPPFDRKLF